MPHGPTPRGFFEIRHIMRYMARRPSGPTRADIVFARLRSDILTGGFEPDSRLGFAELSERYDASTGVLREALPRLVEQGLATSEPQLGFRVISVSVERLAELVEARVALETLMTRMAIEAGGIEWETEVVATHHALARTPGLTGTNVTREWMTAHDAFHLAIVRGAGNHYLFETTSRLRAVAEVYRCWSLPGQELVHRDVPQEHREIMQAVLDRDAPMAVALTERHIRRTAEILIAGRAAATPA